MARFILSCEIEADTLAHAWNLAACLPTDFTPASVTSLASLGLRSFILRDENDDRAIEVWFDVDGKASGEVPA